MRILFVCTGNLCRSPVAERLAAAWARESLADSPELASIHLGSAGLHAIAEQSMHPLSALALNRLGGDAAGFRSRVFTPALADEADLVLTMTQEQRRTVLAMAPRGLRRTFMLTEAAELLADVDVTGLRLVPVTGRAQELARRLDERRRRGRPAGADIPDPVRRRSSVHQQVADAVAAALRPLADVLFTSVRTQPAVPVEESPRDTSALAGAADEPDPAEAQDDEPDDDERDADTADKEEQPI